MSQVTAAIDITFMLFSVAFSISRSEMKRQSKGEARKGGVESLQVVVALVVKVPHSVTEVERDQLRYAEAANRTQKPAEVRASPEPADVPAKVDPEFVDR